MALFSGTQQEYYDANDHGGYQFITLKDLINNFDIAYVGEGKIIPKLKRTDISFHAQRALQELSYDTLKSTKSQELVVPSSLSMKLPHDYVNYVKLSVHDGGGSEKLLIPTRVSSNPDRVLEDADRNFLYDSTGTLLHANESSVLTKFKEADLPGSNINDIEHFDYYNIDIDGRRYGIEPEYAQGNGYYFIDELAGKIYFSSNLSGETVIIKYISDGVATEGEMKVHKFAEEAVYKYIAYAVVSTSSNVPEYIVNRFKKERFATRRVAKLRLSQLKSEEIAAVMRNKAKWIKR